jgi:hypothetical protein
MTMVIQAQTISSKPRREPWNKGKLIGQKPPLRPKHVWSIRTRLQMDGRTRDLAMFNLAIDSKLRGCDVVALRVEERRGEFGGTGGIAPTFGGHGAMGLRHRKRPCGHRNSDLEDAVCEGFRMPAPS